MKAFLVSLYTTCVAVLQRVTFTIYVNYTLYITHYVVISVCHIQRKIITLRSIINTKNVNSTIISPLEIMRLAVRVCLGSSK